MTPEHTCPVCGAPMSPRQERTAKPERKPRLRLLGERPPMPAFMRTWILANHGPAQLAHVLRVESRQQRQPPCRLSRASRNKPALQTFKITAGGKRVGTSRPWGEVAGWKPSEELFCPREDQPDHKAWYASHWEREEAAKAARALPFFEARKRGLLAKQGAP